MAYFPTPRGQKTMSESLPVVIASEQSNLSARQRSSRDYAIFEAKTIGDWPALLWDTYEINAGATYTNNHINLHSTVGGTGYIILQSRITNPYLSTQTNWAEFSIMNFQSEANIVKKIGMYISNAVAPYQSNLDGFWIENDGTTIRFKVANNGTVIINTPITDWDNYAAISSYNFANSSLFRFSYIWNECIQIQMFINGKWAVVHTLNYSGVSSTPLWLNPYLHARCELISNDVNNTFGLDIYDVAFGCDNLLENQTRVYSFTTAGLSMPTISTPPGGVIGYALMKLQKTADKDVCVQLIDFDVTIDTTDACVIAVMIDPNVTETSPVTLNNQGATEIKVTAFTGASSISTTLKPGHPKFVWSRMYKNSIAFNASNMEHKNSLFTFLQEYLNETGVPLYLCAIPLTGNQVINASVNVRIL